MNLKTIFVFLAVMLGLFMLQGMIFGAIFFFHIIKYVIIGVIITMAIVYTKKLDK